MAQPDRPARRGPTRRTDPTRPPSTRTRTRTRTRRDGDRRPYPTAPTRTRPSPAAPRTARTRSRSRGSTSTPSPATVWVCGPTPIDPDTAWPTPIVSKIVTSLSTPGDRVALLPWPTPSQTPPPTAADPDEVIERTGDTDLADALAAINQADRTGHVLQVEPDPATTGPGSRPFWDDLLDDPDHAPTAAPPPHPGAGLSCGDTAPHDLDLIITSLRPASAGDHTSDLVARLAARLLRTGGTLAVLTHCDWSRGVLVDPTGVIVAAGQNADLLYLQHIVALHAPIRAGRVVPDLDRPADDEHTRSQHRATVRGLPAPHRRIHSDVLLFAQPRDHQPPRLAPGDAAFDAGVIR